MFSTTQSAAASLSAQLLGGSHAAVVAVVARGFTLLQRQQTFVKAIAATSVVSHQQQQQHQNHWRQRRRFHRGGGGATAAAAAAAGRGGGGGAKTFMGMPLLAATVGMAAGCGTGLVICEEAAANDSTTHREEDAATANPTPTAAPSTLSDTRQQPGFKERKVLSYDDRIRRFSPPDRIFRYFATVQIDGTVYMKPSDFARALVGGQAQPQEYTIDVYEKLPASFGLCHDASKHLLDHDEADGSVRDMGGLISYADFLFLMTAISAPPLQFELAFKMFDLDGNGIVDLQEFSKVQYAVMRTTSTGKKLPGQDSTVVSADALAHSHILQRFFGPNGDDRLDITKFRAFLEEVQRDLLHIRFLHVSQRASDGTNTFVATEVALARMILADANIKKGKLAPYLDRIRAHYGADKPPCITFDDVERINAFVQRIEEVGMALRLFHAAGVGTTKEDLCRVARIVADVELGDHITDFLFILFDTDGDGQLSEREFVRVLRDANSYGLNKESGFGVERGFKALWLCIRRQMAKSDEQAEEEEV